jgi:hypothetical protein
MLRRRIVGLCTRAKKSAGRYKRIRMVCVYPFPVEPDTSLCVILTAPMLIRTPSVVYAANLNKKLLLVRSAGGSAIFAIDTMGIVTNILGLRKGGSNELWPLGGGLLDRTIGIETCPRWVAKG